MTSRSGAMTPNSPVNRTLRDKAASAGRGAGALRLSPMGYFAEAKISGTGPWLARALDAAC